MRGRVQIVWNVPNQARANAIRDFLVGELATRNFVTHVPPSAQLRMGAWVVVADVSFETQSERDQVEAILRARQGTDQFVRAGSKVTVHQCDHDVGGNSCRDTYLESVKQ